MFLFINLSGGQTSWYTAPLMLMLPFILNGGLFELVFDTIYMLTSSVSAT